jgi:uncharacterized protein
MTGIVHAESRDRARGTQIGIACELRWKLDGAHDGRRSPHPGWARRPGLSDLHHPAFCNPLTAVRDGPLTDGAAACEYTIRFVRVPELTAEPARQRDEPPGNPMVRYCSSSCQANITFDADRFVTPARTIANAPGEAADQGLSQRRNGPAAVLALPMRTCSGYPVTVPDRLPDPAWSSAARWPGPGIPRARCPTTRHTTGGRSPYPANTKAPLAGVHNARLCAPNRWTGRPHRGMCECSQVLITGLRELSVPRASVPSPAGHTIASQYHDRTIADDPRPCNRPASWPASDSDGSPLSTRAPDQRRCILIQLEEHGAGGDRQ